MKEEVESRESDKLENRITVPSYEDLLNYSRQVGGAIGFKDINSIHLAANLEAVKLFGFKKESQLIGINDANLNCDAAKYADLFRQQDLEVIKTKRSMQKLDILRYVDSKLQFRLGTKSPLYNKENDIIGVSYNSQQITSFLLKKISSLFRIMHNEHSNTFECSSFILKENIDSNNILSPTENSILFFLVRGKNARETAHILKKNKHTVESHISNIKIKLGCSKKSEIFDKATELGWYNVIPLHLVF